MSHFSLGHFALSHFRGGQFGLPSSPEAPAVLSSALTTSGWYATDAGILTATGPFVRKPAGQFRRYFLDFSPLQQARVGDVFDGDAEAVCEPADMAVTDVLKDGLRVYFTLSGGTPAQEYRVAVTVPWASGAVTVRKPLALVV